MPALSGKLFLSSEPSIQSRDTINFIPTDSLCNVPSDNFLGIIVIQYDHVDCGKIVLYYL